MITDIKQAAAVFTAIIRAVSARTGVSTADILGSSKVPHISRARHIGTAIAREHGFTYQEIADGFKLRKQASVYYAVKKSTVSKP